ncbi:hypothetical protein V1478_012225 [Vespula squamosa]|uniref:Uncharacterized protein n=1 Tax=Vespula squamosa TaxID=30214 RepID=A0ABD2ACK6_VESSQ
MILARGSPYAAATTRWDLGRYYLRYSDNIILHNTMQMRVLHLQATTARDNKVGPLRDFEVTNSVLLWISSCAHRSFRRMSSLVVGRKAEQTRELCTSSMRLRAKTKGDLCATFQLRIQSYFGFRVVHIAARNNEELKLCTGSPWLRETTIKSDLWKTLSISDAIRIVHWRSLATRDDNKVGPLDDFVDFWRSFALTFDECTSQLPRDAFHGSNNEE